MNQDQVVIIVILLTTIALFLWGRWRHDLVAIGALLACVLGGLLPVSNAFLGFGHPAVITVASVLILSSGLESTGAVDTITRHILPAKAGPLVTLAMLTSLGSLLSAFMNNVGALALLMPVAIQIATKYGLPPGKILMPLSFGTILGGMTTLIGTPPNLIVSGFRQRLASDGFAMFDFTPVGFVVASTGILFLVLIGWRLVPERKRPDNSNFDTGTYFTEVRLTEDSILDGTPLREVELLLEQADAQIVGLVRKSIRINAPGPRLKLRSGDILVIEADPKSLNELLTPLGLRLEEAASTVGTPEKGRGPEQNKPETEEYILQELVVMAGSNTQNRSATDLQLRSLYGINLLALSRQGARSIKRLRSTALQAGDVLLVQGSPEAIAHFAADSGCLPLAARALRLPDQRRAFMASTILLLAVAGAAFGLLPAAISFSAGVLAFMALRILPLNKVYEAVDWPVVVLLAALIPVAGAMATTGTADLLAGAMLQNLAQGNPVVALALILIVTMTLSDFMNNAATAAVMCPLAISVARQLGVYPDAFLMAVAIGASCAFLTPIGHQNNTLILGPGGFRFGDYWRLGLLLELLVIAVSLPMLLWIWPL